MATFLRSWKRLPLSSLRLQCSARARLWSSSLGAEEDSTGAKEVAVKHKEGEGLTEYVNPEDLVSSDIVAVVYSQQADGFLLGTSE